MIQVLRKRTGMKHAGQTLVLRSWRASVDVVKSFGMKIRWTTLKQFVTSLNTVSLLVAAIVALIITMLFLARKGPHTRGAQDLALYGGDAIDATKVLLLRGVTGFGAKQHGPHAKRFVHHDRLENAEGCPRPWQWSYK